MSAVSVTQVPKLTVVTGGSTGDGYWALGGRPMQPRFMFLWPQAFVASAAPEHVRKRVPRGAISEGGAVPLIAHHITHHACVCVCALCIVHCA